MPRGSACGCARTSRRLLCSQPRHGRPTAALHAEPGRGGSAGGCHSRFAVRAGSRASERRRRSQGRRKRTCPKSPRRKASDASDRTGSRPASQAWRRPVAVRRSVRRARRAVGVGVIAEHVEFASLAAARASEVDHDGILVSGGASRSAAKRDDDRFSRRGRTWSAPDSGNCERAVGASSGATPAVAPG